MEPVVVHLSAPVTAEHAGALCVAIRQRLAAGGPRVVVCRVLGPVDLTVVGVLARMQLMAGRLQAGLQVQARSSDLTRLLELTGLEQVLPLCLEARGQAEPGEQPGVQEVVQVADPAV